MGGGGGYGSARDQAGLDYLQSDIDAFVANYSPDKLTLFFFPGGMASQLYVDKKEDPSTEHDFRLTWLSCSIVFGAAKELGMDDNGVDVGSHFVVPKGYIDFYIHPYDQFAKWCKSRGVQLFTFGYDWRRSSQEAADLFLDEFLPKLDAAIGAKLNSNQDQGNLKNYAFLGHSLGGMVLKLALNRGSANPYVKGATKAITVATPYYGGGGQVHGYLVGFKWFNWTVADPDHENYIMARLNCSLYGGYEFLYLSQKTYDKYNFKKDTKYTLGTYPCTDGKNPADPYAPTAQSDIDPAYYPLFEPYNYTMLANAAQVAEAVAQPVDADIAAKFYNIRGVQTRNGKDYADTIVSATWNRVSRRHFNPDKDPDPVTDTKGPGDGTVPAWSARLLQLLDFPNTDPHVITLWGDFSQFQHMHLLSIQAVQSQLEKLLGLHALSPLRKWVPPDMSTRREFDRFLENRPHSLVEKSQAERQSDLLDYVYSHNARKRQKLVWRAYTDMLSGPDARKPREPRKATRRTGRKDRR